MKAIILEKAGDVDNFQIKEIDQPSISAKEILVETKALSVNPVDFKVRADQGTMNMIYGEDRPAILGWDIAGVIKEKGAKVTDFEVGDRVFGMVNFPGEGKAYAEYVAAPASHLAKIPEGISFEDAAASTLAALTAFQVLKGKVKTGDRVLIHAGSGGVGHFAVQIAKSMGAYAISTSSGSNRDFVLSLGANQHVDYRKEKFEEMLSEIDFIFDMFNGEVLQKSVELVRKGGTVVSIPTPEFSEEVQKLAEEKDVSLQFHMVESSGADMEQLAQLLKRGALKPHISQIFTFEEMKEAHIQLESGRTVGKVVVTL
ncbi:MAG: NADP-dependent oxidoreductase [Bacteroidota bacterium]